MKSQDSGRSLVEMLGVLALIAVLTLTAIQGYRYAITKFKSNDTMKELNLRAVNISADLFQRNTLIPSTSLDTGAVKTTPLGYDMTGFMSNTNTDYFEIDTTPVPQNVCKQLLADYTTPSLILVEDIPYKGDKDLCKKPNNLMTFVYKIDLGKNKCSDKGFLDTDTLQCKCAGNTYKDPLTNDCLCPAGYLWSETQKTCIESICLEGQFESLENGCIPCEADAIYRIADTATHKSLCEICPQRQAMGETFLVCAKKCTDGMMTTNGTCVKCDDKRLELFAIPSECEKCPNRYTSQPPWAGVACPLRDYCEKGKKFPGWNKGGTFVCLSCDDLNFYAIGAGSEDADYCNSCVNDRGIKNRSVIGDNCHKTACDSGEFLGANGRCYSCQEGRKIAVKENSGCEEATCGRAVVEGFCQITDCDSRPNHALFPNGACQDCSTSDVFNSYETECDLCPLRGWVSDGRCKLNTCKKGVDYPWIGNTNMCYPCKGSGDGSGSTGSSSWSQEYCEACGNYIANGYCYNSNSCKKGEQFRALSSGNYKFCTDCAYTNAIKIGTHPQHRAMCTTCITHKRFFAGEYCYRCDTPEQPTVSNDAEKAACLACGIRSVQGGKCVLEQ